MVNIIYEVFILFNNMSCAKIMQKITNKIM